MAQVITHMTMSLDGFIAQPDDNPGPLFDWYGTGDVTTPSANPEIAFQTDAASATMLRDMLLQNGALVAGRRLFDVAQGWGGTHPASPAVVVVTHDPPADWRRAHPDAPFTFVTTGVADAIAQAKETAGDRDVIVASPTITQQCLDLGLLDEIVVSLAPVLLGAGIRWFDHLSQIPVMLDDPRVIAGDRVTHLRYRVRKPQTAAA